MNIRQATAEDLLEIQYCNQQSLPTTYKIDVFMEHQIKWPELMYVAEEYHRRRIVGYVMGKINDDQSRTGYISSVAVLRSHRRCGLAQKLMEQVLRAMIEVYSAKMVTLRVRVSNRPAIQLYQAVLEFRITETLKTCYANGEDGHIMQRSLVDFALKNRILPANPVDYFPVLECKPISERAHG